jgi:hypothetical protein
MSCGSAGPAEAGARRAARCRVTLCLDDVVLTAVSDAGVFAMSVCFLLPLCLRFPHLFLHPEVQQGLR